MTSSHKPLSFSFHLGQDIFCFISTCASVDTMVLCKYKFQVGVQVGFEFLDQLHLRLCSQEVVVQQTELFLNLCVCDMINF